MRNHEPLGAVRGRRAAAQAMVGHKRILAPTLEDVVPNGGGGWHQRSERARMAQEAGMGLLVCPHTNA